MSHHPIVPICGRTRHRMQEEPVIINGEDDLIRLQRAWANYHVLLAMAQLGLFDVLQDGTPRTAEALADDLGADARAMDICCRIMVRAGLLRYDDGMFHLTPVARTQTAPLDELK